DGMGPDLPFVMARYGVHQVAGLEIGVGVELGKQLPEIRIDAANLRGQPFAPDVEGLVAEEQVGTEYVGEFQLCADAPACSASLAAVGAGIDVGGGVRHEAVGLVVQPGNPEIGNAGDERPAYGSFNAAAAILADLNVQVSRVGIGGFAGGNAQQAYGG